MARTPRSVSTSALPTTSPPAAAPTTIMARLVNLVPWRSDHAGTPVVDVPFAQGRHRYAAADAPGSEHSLIRDEDYHGSPTPDPNSQQQQQVDAGEHGGGRSRRCC
ncbi:uncharacterized protein F5891DRAFT_987431 [Suillus fuscotomentosus]|uniref:Uncharacterized protein n=1 Tax=Suillus fuscotomentosus TaxID=1912939 RepID=A0AAD4DQ33_9AGAM|nr:uncharacterized protein F5891DRAFT_987431 [Suillus fuscotomentosus]KAG1889118.1 hypothetical protein F5891DRAFT_987431 [Suillus fuscotomentosus]